jgi:predicted nucleotidyltransferase
VRHQRVLQTMRQRLLEDALQFVRTAMYMPGVVRIALVGSLATAKPAPKDVDLLLTVTNETDLPPLARAARRLQGMCRATIMARRCSWPTRLAPT